MKASRIAPENSHATRTFTSEEPISPTGRGLRQPDFRRGAQPLRKRRGQNMRWREPSEPTGSGSCVCSFLRLGLIRRLKLRLLHGLIAGLLALLESLLVLLLGLRHVLLVFLSR